MFYPINLNPILYLIIDLNSQIVKNLYSSSVFLNNDLKFLIIKAAWIFKSGAKMWRQNRKWIPAGQLPLSPPPLSKKGNQTQCVRLQSQALYYEHVCVCVCLCVCVCVCVQV